MLPFQGHQSFLSDFRINYALHVKTGRTWAAYRRLEKDETETKKLHIRILYFLNFHLCTLLSILRSSELSARCKRKEIRIIQQQPRLLESL